MPVNRTQHAHMRLHRVVIGKLSVIALIGAASVCGTAGIAAAAATAYGPPPPATSVPPGGFTAVITTVSVGPAGGTIGPVSVDGADLTVTVPRGAFPSVVQITVTAPDLSLITPPAGITVVAGAGIQVTLNGAPYPGTFLKAVTATFRSSKIMPSSDVVVWNGTSFVIDPASTTTEGMATVSFDSDPDFAVESPASTAVTTVPGATSPVTGEPFLGEGILAGGLVLAGAGGIFLSRRRRTRALPAGLLARGARRGRPGPACLACSAPIRSVTTRMTTSREGNVDALVGNTVRRAGNRPSHAYRGHARRMFRWPGRAPAPAPAAAGACREQAAADLSRSEEPARRGRAAAKRDAVGAGRRLGEQGSLRHQPRQWRRCRQHLCQQRRTIGDGVAVGRRRPGARDGGDRGDGGARTVQR